MGTGVSDVRVDLLTKENAGLRKPAGGRTVPTTGMRGGLGRTLLTAFLILTIFPIAVTGGYAALQNRRNVEREAGARLVSVAALKGEMLRHWVTSITSELYLVPALFTMPEASAQETAYAAWWAEVVTALQSGQRTGTLGGCAVLDGDAATLWISPGCAELGFGDQGVPVDALRSGTGSAFGLVAREESLGSDQASSPLPVLVLAVQDRSLVLCLEDRVVTDLLRGEAGVGMLGTGETGQVGLISGDLVWSNGPVVDRDWGEGITPGAAEPGYALYQKSNDERVLGALSPLPEYGMGVLVEQAQVEVLASTERMAATLIAWVLAATVATTWIAATVIRQITRPVLDLTESAVAMSEGDLDQRLPVRSRDEIGILTHVFNQMASELSSLYSDLEDKVVERTRRLQEANYQIQRRALHLQASQEVSQAITSVRDPEMLLKQVTDLVRSHFVYSSVAIYLIDPGGVEARLQACSPVTAHPDSVTQAGLGGEGMRWPRRCHPGDGSIVGRAIRKGTAQVDNEPVDVRDGWTSRVTSRVAVPLKIAGLRGGDGNGHNPTIAETLDGNGNGDAIKQADLFGLVGILAVMTTVHEGVQRDELKVLEALANQVTIALENARAYERERLAAEQLEMAEAFKARFLANMSHDLIEPLNTIVGFSRLLLKGIEGPLTDRQREDLAQIYTDGQHLHFLIYDILSISELEAGLVELRLQPVNVAELVAGVLPTAGALIRGKAISLHQDIPPDLPDMRGDPLRLRQVLVHLLNNAAKYTEAGEITICAWASDGEVYVSVRDTGVGISREDRPRLFMHFETGDVETDGRRRRGAGLGLSFCKEYLELHGGHIWVDSEVGVGSVFTFSVPADMAT